MLFVFGCSIGGETSTVWGKKRVQSNGVSHVSLQLEGSKRSVYSFVLTGGFLRVVTGWGHLANRIVAQTLILCNFKVQTDFKAYNYWRHDVFKSWESEHGLKRWAGQTIPQTGKPFRKGYVSCVSTERHSKTYSTGCLGFLKPVVEFSVLWNSRSSTIKGKYNE